MGPQADRVSTLANRKLANPICCWGFLSGMLSLDSGSMWSLRSRVLPDIMA